MGFTHHRAALKSLFNIMQLIDFELGDGLNARQINAPLGGGFGYWVNLDLEVLADGIKGIH